MFRSDPDVVVRYERELQHVFHFGQLEEGGGGAVQSVRMCNIIGSGGVSAIAKQTVRAFYCNRTITVNRCNKLRSSLTRRENTGTS